MVKLGEISAIDRWLEMSRMQELVEALRGGGDDIAHKEQGSSAKRNLGMQASRATSVRSNSRCKKTHRFWWVFSFQSIS